jgi:hypothetical protein
MLEIYMDERGELAIENMEALIKAFPQFADRATASALKSEGWRLRELIKDAIQAGGPKNAKWQDLHRKTPRLAAQKRGWVKNYRMVWKGEKGSKRRVREYWVNQPGGGKFRIKRKGGPLSKLAGAVRYEYDKDLEAVSIGFIRDRGVSDRMLSLARLHAKGEKTKITPRMRKMLFAMGVPIKKTTTTLETPARPVIEPVFRMEKDNIPKNIEKKFLAAIRRYMEAKEK